MITKRWFDSDICSSDDKNDLPMRCRYELNECLVEKMFADIIAQLVNWVILSQWSGELN